MHDEPALRFVNWSEAGAVTAGDGAVPVAINSLDEEHERRRLMKAAGMPPAFVDDHWPATDLRSLDPADFERYVDLEAYYALIGDTPRSGVIGNSVSQRDAMAAMAGGGAPLVVMFEDDVRPVVPDAFDILATLLGPLYAYAQSGAAFLCHLGIKRSQRPLRTNRIAWKAPGGASGRWIIRDAGPAYKVYRAHAYVMSNTAVRRTLAGETRMRVGADKFYQRFNLGYFDRFLFVEPGLFSQDHDIPSSIRNYAARTDNAAEMGRLSLVDRGRRLFARRVGL